MGKELAEPDWNPLTTAEVRAVLGHYQPRDLAGLAPEAVVTWRSPRPMSAAGLARWPGRGASDDGDGSRGGCLFLKRHDPRVRTAGQLAAEHDFIGHLRGLGVPAPAVLRTGRGDSTVSFGGSVYEVHQAAAGADRYRNAVSWSPFRTLGDAYAAGAALARLHRAAAGFSRPGRPQAVLIATCEVVTSGDPVAAVARILRERPRLDRYLSRRPWPDDLARYHGPVIGRAGPRLAPLRRQWGHGDWHPSNLTWCTAAGPDGGAAVAGVMDFGLANRTFAVHDLATALERSTIAWLDLAESGHAAADTDAMDALLDGYESVRPLSTDESSALPEILPVVHLEYALSEIEYFAGVLASPGRADLAYDGYLIGHTRWFEGAEGSAVTEHLRRRARRALRGLRQPGWPAAAATRGGRRHNRPDVAIRRLVQIDDHRGVVTGPGALASLAVDPRRLHPAGHRAGRQDQVDPHAEILVEHTGPVVPVGEHPLLRPPVPHHVPQAQALQLGQGGAFRRGDMSLAHVGGRVEHVGVGRRDVHVPADQRGLRARPDDLLQRGQPGQFVLVVLGVRHPPVRNIYRMDPDAGAGRGHRTGLLVREAGPASQARHHIVQPDPRQDGHTVPPGLAMQGGLVPAVPELVVQKLAERIVGQLGLLEADDIGLALIQPRQQPGNPLLD
jgi:Ser/Thr protein kinase RdoA (MazF antagonist)